MTVANRCLIAILCCVVGLACDGGPTLPLDAGPRDASAPVDVQRFDAHTVDAPTDAAAPVDGGASIRISGIIVTPAGARIAGATVSDDRHAEVTPDTTDADGAFEIFVPANEPILFAVRAEGRLATLGLLPPLDTDIDTVGARVFTREELDALRAPLTGSTPGTGTILLGTGNAPIAPGTVAIRFSTVDVDPVAFSYFDAAMPPAPDPSATATTTSSQAIAETEVLGSEMIVPVRGTPIAGQPCSADTGWAYGSMTDVLAVPVRPDAVTFGTFHCRPPSEHRTVWGKLTADTPTSPSAGPPIAGASVCLHGGATCVTSEPDGLYAVNVPDSSDFALTFEAAGREPVLVPFRMRLGGASDPITRDVGLPPEGYIAATATAYGATQSASRGAVEFFTAGPGVTVTMPIGTGDGPHYLGPMAAIDPSLTETSSQGWGFFFDVEPAAFVELTFDHSDAALTCRWIGDDAWSTTTPESIRAPTAAGYLTFATLGCR